MSDSSTVDPIHLLETGRWTGYQKALTLLAAVAVIFDGFDIQILGFAIPSIMREWHVARAAFSPILALGMAGMAAGSPFAGYVGDRFGRRTALIGCVLLFGGATILTAYSHGLLELAALRFVTGMGAGGALPNASALSAEFAPRRWRPVAVTFTIVCVPLGGMIGGVAAGWILPVLGWRAMYVFGGAAPILLAILLYVALPESPRFLARHPRRWQELVRLMQRMGRTVPAGARFEDVRAPIAAAKVPLRSLFTGGLLRETLGLWLAFFACLNGIYLVFGWLPAMLTAKGFGVVTASSGLAAYNFGGVVGVVVCAAAASLMGSRRPLIWAAVAGVVSAAGLLLVPLDPAGSQIPVIVGFGLIGFFANAVQTTMFALAAHVYSTEVRASGIAAAAAAGRVGGLLSSFAGAAIIQAGSGAYLCTLAVSMAVTAAGLAIMRNHFGGTTGTKHAYSPASAVPTTPGSAR
jgi:AAHS family 4-hydroxybenzoate transporter-like MFS transporter